MKYLCLKCDSIIDEDEIEFDSGFNGEITEYFNSGCTKCGSDWIEKIIDNENK